MKNYKYLILAFFILTISCFKVEALKNTLPLLGKTIIVDIGHGGRDPGTIYRDIYEKDINLKIGLKLEKELIKSGAKVVVTRDGDYDLSSPNTDRRKKSDFDNRIRLINGSQAQMYVSIHLNYLLLTQYYGAQVFYDEVFEKNIEIAKTMQEVLNNNTRSRRVIKKIPSTNYLYARLKVPGVLIECGFLSNYNERIKLQKEDYQQKLAEIITKGIVKSI